MSIVCAAACVFVGGRAVSIVWSPCAPPPMHLSRAIPSLPMRALQDEEERKLAIMDSPTPTPPSHTPPSGRGGAGAGHHGFTPSYTPLPFTTFRTRRSGSWPSPCWPPRERRRRAPIDERRQRIGKRRNGQEGRQVFVCVGWVGGGVTMDSGAIESLAARTPPQKLLCILTSRIHTL